MATIVVTLDTADVEAGVRRVRDELSSLAAIDAFEAVELGAARAGAALSDVSGDAGQAGASFDNLTGLANTLANASQPLSDIEIAAIGADAVQGDIQGLIQFAEQLVQQTEPLDDILIDVDAGTAVAELNGFADLLDDTGTAAIDTATDTEQLTASFEEAGDSAGIFGNALGVIRPLLPALGFAAVASGVARLATEFDVAQRSVVAVTGDLRTANDVTAQLSDIARNAGVGIGETADLFQRFTIATRDLNLSQSDTIGLVSTLTRGFALFSSSTAEASNAAVQLAQGLATGRLQGDELRSVLENFPPLAQAIADTLGVTVGELRDLGAEGAITSEIVVEAIDNLGESLTDIEAIAGQTVPQAFGGLITALTELFGTLDQAVGASDAVVAGLNLLSDGIARVSDIAREATGPISGLFDIFFGGISDVISDLTGGFIDFSGSISRVEQAVSDGVLGLANYAAEAVGLGDAVTTSREAIEELTGSIAEQQLQTEQVVGSVGDYTQILDDGAAVTAAYSADLEQLAQDLARANTAQGLLNGGAGDYSEIAAEAADNTREFAAAQREAAAAAREEGRARGELIDFIRRGGIERAREQNVLEEAFRRQVELFDQVAEANRQAAELASVAVEGIADALGVSSGAVEAFGENFVRVLNGIGLTTAETFDQFAANVARALGVSQEQVEGFFDVANDALDIFGIELEDVFGRRAAAVFEQFGGLSDTTIDLILSGGQRVLEFFGIQFPGSVQTAGGAVEGLGGTTGGVFDTILNLGRPILDFFGLQLPGSQGIGGTVASLLDFGAQSNTVFGDVTAGLGIVQGEVTTTTAGIGGLGTSTAALGPIFGAVIQTGILGFQSLQSELGTTSAIFLTVLNPAIAVTEGVLNLFGLSATDIFRTIGDVATQVWNGIRAAGEAVVNALQAAFGALRDAVVAVFNVIRDIATTVFNAIRALGQAVVSALQAAFRAFQAAATAVFNAVRAIATTVFNAVRALGQALTNALSAAFRAFQAAATAVFNAIGSVARTIFNGIQSAGNALLGGLRSVASSIASAFQSAFQGIQSAASSAFNFVTSAAQRAASAAGSAIGSITSAAGRAARGIGGAIGGAIGGISRGIRSLFADGGVITGPTSVGGTTGRNQRGTVLTGPSLLGNAGNITPTRRLGLAGEAGPEAILPLAQTSAGLGVRAVGMTGGGNTTVINRIVMISTSSETVESLESEVINLGASIEQRVDVRLADLLSELR